MTPGVPAWRSNRYLIWPAEKFAWPGAVAWPAPPCCADGLVQRARARLADGLRDTYRWFVESAVDTLPAAAG